MVNKLHFVILFGWIFATMLTKSNKNLYYKLCKATFTSHSSVALIVLVPKWVLHEYYVSTVYYFDLKYFYY